MWSRLLSLFTPLIEKIAGHALELGLKQLEVKYPGLKPLMEDIIQFVDHEVTSGNAEVVEALRLKFLK